MKDKLKKNKLKESNLQEQTKKKKEKAGRQTDTGRWVCFVLECNKSGPLRDEHSTGSNRLQHEFVRPPTAKQRGTHSDVDSAQVTSALFRLPSNLCMADDSDEGLPAAPERKTQ